MNKAIITAVSALAIFAAVPAMAEMKAQVKTSAEASKTGYRRRCKGSLERH